MSGGGSDDGSGMCRLGAEIFVSGLISSGCISFRGVGAVSAVSGWISFRGVGAVSMVPGWISFDGVPVAGEARARRVNQGLRLGNSPYDSSTADWEPIRRRKPLGLRFVCFCSCSLLFTSRCVNAGLKNKESRYKYQCYDEQNIITQGTRAIVITST